jgi:hypothetical protein
MKRKYSLTQIIAVAGLTSAVIGCSLTSEKGNLSPEQARKFIEKSEKSQIRASDNLNYAWHNWHRFSTQKSKNLFASVMGKLRQTIRINPLNL